MAKVEKIIFCFPDFLEEECLAMYLASPTSIVGEKENEIHLTLKGKVFDEFYEALTALKEKNEE